MIVRALAVPFLVVLVGCTANAPMEKAKTASPAGPRGVAAEVDGKAITVEELDKRAAGQLQMLRDQEYEIRKNTLDAMIDEQLLKKAAAARGVSEVDLEKAEVDEKVTAPSPKEIQEIYDANRDRVGGRTVQEVTPQIVSSLRGQRVAERNRAFREELRKQSRVKVLLEQPRTEVPIPTGTAVLGPDTAPVTIVEFSDYLCPYCQKAEEVVSKVLDRYQGKVKFIHRDLLLGRPRSLPVAEAALCAGEQGMFWEYRHDLLTRQGDWSDQDLEGRAARMKLRGPEFKACLASERNEPAVLRSTESGQQLGVTGTPTYFVNGRRMTGVRSEQQFDEIIQSELAGRS
jgi:protein-disulfide isomerase